MEVCAMQPGVIYSRDCLLPLMQYSKRQSKKQGKFWNSGVAIQRGEILSSIKIRSSAFFFFSQ